MMRLTKLHDRLPFRLRRAVPLMALSVMAGLMMAVTWAAGLFLSVESEAGVLSGAAVAVNLGGASGGKIIRFGSGAVSLTPAPTPPPPTPTPPTGGGSTCALPAYPSASCTGVPPGTDLTVMNGNMNINTPGTVIENKDIRGCVEVHAPGVIIRKSKITCENFGVVLSHNDYSGTGLLLEDVDVSCNNTQGTGVGDFNVTVRRANIYNCENGFDLDGSIVVEDSYIHDLIPYNPATDPHVDGIQITPVGNTITIRHNTIYAGDGTSAIISPKVSSGVLVNILIQDNLLAGGGYTLYCQQEGSGNNYRVINNHFSRILYPTVGAYAPWTDCQDEAQVTGNVYHETGQPVLF